PDPVELFQDTKVPSLETPSAIADQQDPNQVPGTDQQLVTGEDGELSIPVEHTTAAHKLLMWPSIRSLLQPKEYDDDYVMKLEEERGLIRCYGRGEGDNTSGDKPSPVPPATPSPAVEEAYPQHASPNGPWGGINQPQSKLEDIGLDDAGRLTSTPEAIRR
ncbi:hypothetical protein FE257_008171, partial [Aspergillus nanangensis]